MTVTQDAKTGELTIRITPQKPALSASGKTKLVATCRLVADHIQVEGKPVTFQVNGYIPATAKEKPAA